MPHWRTLVESNVLRYVDLDGREFTVQIEKIEKGKVVGAGGKSSGKGLIYLTGWPKPMSAGSETLTQIANHYGKEVANWVGKWIKIWPDPSVKYGGEKVGGIRIRNTLPNEEDIAKAQVQIERAKKNQKQTPPKRAEPVEHDDSGEANEVLP
jgi:hypothetical protein